MELAAPTPDETEPTTVESSPDASVDEQPGNRNRLVAVVLVGVQLVWLATIGWLALTLSE